MCHVGDILCFFCDTKIATNALIQRCEAYALKCFGLHEIEKEEIQTHWQDFSCFLPRDTPVPVFDYEECPFKRVGSFKVYDYPCPNPACKKRLTQPSVNKIPRTTLRDCDWVSNFYASGLMPIVQWFNTYLANCNERNTIHRQLIAPHAVNPHMTSLTDSGEISFDFEDVTFCGDEDEQAELASVVPPQAATVLVTPDPPIFHPQQQAKKAPRQPPLPIAIPRVPLMGNSILVSGDVQSFSQNLRARGSGAGRVTACTAHSGTSNATVVTSARNYESPSKDGRKLPEQERPHLSATSQGSVSCSMAPTQSNKGFINDPPAQGHATTSKIHDSPIKPPRFHQGSTQVINYQPQHLQGISLQHDRASHHGCNSSPAGAHPAMNLDGQQHSNEFFCHGGLANKYNGHPEGGFMDNPIQHNFPTGGEQNVPHDAANPISMDTTNSDIAIDPRLWEASRVAYLNDTTDAQLASMGFVRANALPTPQSAERLAANTSQYPESNVGTWVQQNSPTYGSSSSGGCISPFKGHHIGTARGDIDDHAWDTVDLGNKQQPSRRTSKKRKSSKASCLDLYGPTTEQPPPIMTEAMREALVSQGSGGAMAPIEHTAEPIAAAEGSIVENRAQMERMELVRMIQEEQRKFQEQQKADWEAFELRIQHILQGHGGQ
ncbi:predicted protein [Verticillium alfalfae VaMs.102]|uniref:Predicted protein n=1 Tax=Verticillium alfalfae (strain VaMs.102 / ATCC MYA-4576 / FGSC 10136) TaxID=526221 RepID=C9SEQ1_VERA1|nr:predicted protein [Verticillium alfalfae VaMs.102]EEY16644.1 predicted protein [Verticillium alfalfae VaMs.102]